MDRVRQIYDLQKHVVIVCGEGIIGADGRELGAEHASTDPAGNVVLSGASEELRSVLIRKLGDSYFTSKRRNESARAAIFTRKIGHTPAGRPAGRCSTGSTPPPSAGTRSICCSEGKANAVAVLQWDKARGFHLVERLRQ